jgi:hypothetical protein
VKARQEENNYGIKTGFGIIAYFKAKTDYFLPNIIITNKIF